ncbi:transposase [Gordonia terrae]
MVCSVVGVSRSAYRRLRWHRLRSTRAPDYVSSYAPARRHPRHGFRRAWTHLRFDDGIEVNKKKAHRLWKEEGLQVRRAPRRKGPVNSRPQSSPLVHRAECIHV